MRILSALYAPALLFLSGGIAVADPAEPGGTPQAIAQALTNPDEYAWSLFLYLNRQAQLGVAGQADPSKPGITNYDPDKDVVWETWALSSGVDITGSKPIADLDHCNVGKSASGAYVNIVNKSEVFKCPAEQPVPWDSLDRGAANVATMRSPVCFASRIMGPILPERLSALVEPLGSQDIRYS